MSVFWRASVHVWERPLKSESPIRLGPYEETCRKYLLGETDFPKNVALTLVVSTDDGALTVRGEIVRHLNVTAVETSSHDLH